MRWLNTRTSKQRGHSYAIYVIVYIRTNAAQKKCDWMEELEEDAVDVAPVVNGKWIHLGGDEWCCSACGFVITTEGSWDKPTKKYCEDCGARMDGGTEVCEI